MRHLKHNFIHILTICIMIVGILVSMAGTMTVEAAETFIDLDKDGSIEVTVKIKDKPVTEGTLVLFQVADIAEKDGMYLYDPTEEFEGSIFSQEKLEATDLALQLGRFVVDKKLEGTEMPISEEGLAKATDLRLGVYLIMQGETAKDVEPISPFIVTVPIKEDGEYVYDVDATPKLEVKQPDNPDNPPSKTPPSRLPQTGQLWWPVPILLVAGFWLFILGMIIRKNDRD